MNSQPPISNTRVVARRAHDGTRKILIVDDDSAQLKLNKFHLCHAGFDVVTARSAEEALHAARLAVPDVIMSDVLMGEVDGFGFCRMLRNEPALADVPVILMSSHYDSDPDQQLATRVGANALVPRTPDFRAELDVLHKTLRGETQRTLDVPDGELYEDRLRSSATQLVKLLEQARASQARYRTLFDQAHDTISVLSPDGIILEANARWKEVMGVAPEEMVGRHIREFAATGAEDANDVLFREAVEASEGWADAVALKTPSGGTIYMQFSTCVIELEGRSLVLSVGRDVTAQITAARRLAAAEEKYRSLVERLPDVIWTCTPDGLVTFVTPNALKVLGYTPDELYAETSTQRIARVHPDDRTTVSAAFEALMQGGALFDIEYRRKHKDGQWIWLRNRATATYERDGQRYVEGMITDITDRKRLEESLCHAQKMEAIGILTGAIAHDFNNILAVILANSHFLLEDLPADDVRHHEAEDIRDGAERAAALTRQLLAFSRRQVLEPHVLTLSSIVAGLQKMLPRLIGEDIDLAVHNQPDLGSVRVDAGQIEQVIMNLVVNARDAMPDGGQLTIETANVDLEDASAAAQIGATPGQYVVLSVTDTGCGMDAEIKHRIFEPFFTTKEMGRGTGLGLSTCYGIVKQSGGYLYVYSEPGRGASFKVFLPRVDAAPMPRPRATDAVDVRGTETILMIEDDDHLRAAVSRMLTPLGYRVLSASGGAEAAQLAQACGSVDLVLSDVILPSSNGPDVVAQLRQQLGDVRAMFMSGYTDHAVFRSGALPPGTNFIQKPFSPRMLAKKVREVLDA